MPSSVTSGARVGLHPVTTVYDTSVVSAKESLAYWNEGIRALLSPSCTSRHGPGRERFNAFLKNISFGELTLTDYRTDPMRDVRDRRLLVSRPDEHFFLLRFVSGTGQLIQASNHSVMTAGDVVLYDSAQEFEWLIDSAALIQIARLPRKQVMAKLPAAERLVSRKIGHDNPFSTMIGNLVSGGLTFSDEASAFDVGRYAASVGEMLCTFMELALVPPSSNPHTHDVLARGKRILLDNVANPDFDFATFASLLSVSPRTVCRVFASEGTTAIRWLWDQRLRLAHELLCSSSSLNVSDVAIRCGFSDFSHFSRAFKKRYNQRPSTMLCERPGQSRVALTAK